MKNQKTALALLVKSAEAAIAYDLAIHSCADDPKKMNSFCTAQGEDLDALYFKWLGAAQDGLEAVKKLPTMANKAKIEPSCVCGSTVTIGSVHRIDGPCYVDETFAIANDMEVKFQGLKKLAWTRSGMDENSASTEYFYRASDVEALIVSSLSSSKEPK